ncbi:MAG TPA: glycoside hydrolase family 2 TIM barrel-domain containing protein [Bacteroidales bacterium]|nr:glycoside hydrolase family 2 TIM barrel-domain containing protein [Bacteroidales bacterium]
MSTIRNLFFMLPGAVILMLTGCGSETVISPVKQVKLTDFELQSSFLIPSTGEEISNPDYQSNVYWFPVMVPSTVLTGLVENNVYPDPYQGMNNMFIPDASDEFNKKYNLEQYSHIPNLPNPWSKPYWYRSVFTVPESDNGRHFQLIFKGINYRAAVWVNGKQIADSTLMSGMFAEYSLNVSSLIKPGQQNGLAVKIYPLDFAGLPSDEQLTALCDFFPNGGPTGDIGKNVTMLCSVGWDWMPPVRDRNMGIWAPIFLRTSGGVTIASPKLVTDLPNLPDTSLARISLSLSLLNHTAAEENGKLTVTMTPYNFNGNPVSFTRDVKIGAGNHIVVDLNSDNTKELEISKPVLWWPNGYGKPNLYRIRMQYANGGEVSDDTTFLFGIRTVATKAVDVNGFIRRDFYVNGQRIHITGGAWVPDMMLNRDSVRYDYEFRLCQNSNINLVRIWGGGVTPREEFWDAADRFGLLIWSDFWVTGDTQGEFKGSPDWPLEGDIFIKNVKSTILRIRNHPSLLLWTGGNEGHARRELYDVMRNSIITLDGTRPYIPSSSGFASLPEGWDGAWPDNMPSGVYSGGPYTWKDPKDYYNRAIAGRDWVFKDETGIPSQPPYNIMPRIIPDLVWDSKAPFPLNNTWGYHDAATGNGRWDLYYEEMVKRYGAPVSMEEFCDKMQLMNATGYQGIFEAAGHKLNDIGGVMLWKLNAAFPSVVWQVYDWYLQPNAGYYFMQNAVEPLHMQLNLISKDILVINKTYKQVADFTAQIDVFDIESKSLLHEEKIVSLEETDVKITSNISQVLNTNNDVSFVLLRLKDKAGRVISSNTYWQSKNDEYKIVNGMTEESVEVKVANNGVSRSEKSWTVELSNPGTKLAFFVRAQLLKDGEEVLPSFWSGNYISLLPGEQTSLKVSCPEDLAAGGTMSIKISGWNVPGKEIKLEKSLR